MKGHMINLKSIFINTGEIVMLVDMVGDILPPSNYLYLNKNVTPGQRKNKEIKFLGILSRYILGYCTNLFINPYSMRKILKMDPIK